MYRLTQFNLKNDGPAVIEIPPGPGPGPMNDAVFPKYSVFNFDEFVKSLDFDFCAFCAFLRLYQFSIANSGLGRIKNG